MTMTMTVIVLFHFILSYFKNWIVILNKLNIKIYKRLHALAKLKKTIIILHI